MLIVLEMDCEVVTGQWGDREEGDEGEEDVDEDAPSTFTCFPVLAP